MTRGRRVASAASAAHKMRKAHRMATDTPARRIEVPYRLSLAVWSALAAAGAYFFLGDNYLGIDSRFQLALLFLAFSANWCIHDVVYKRKSLGGALLSLAIENLLFGSGIWISLAFFGDDPYLSLLPPLVAMFAARHLEALVRRVARKT